MMHYPEAIGWTLLHFLWQATVIAIIYRLIDWRLARRRADVRYSVALAALLCMLGASIGTLIYEQMRLSHAAFRDLSQTLTFINTSAGSIPRLSSPGDFIQDHTDQLLRWVDCAWLIGVCFFALRALGGAWRLSRFRSILSFEAAGELAARFSAVAQEMAVKNRSALRIHPTAETPFVAGLFRSVIYLPISALTSLTPDQLDTILIHELAHVRRADYAWNLLQSMMETLFFFHPAVWWLGRILRERRELCCDDVVVEMCSDPLTYAKALLALAEHQPIRPRLAMALDGHQEHNRLFTRIARILGEAGAAGGDSGSNAASRLLIPAIAGLAVLYCACVIPLSVHVSFVHAEHATHINANRQAPFNARGIPPNRPQYRFASALTSGPREAAGQIILAVAEAPKLLRAELPLDQTISSGSSQNPQSEQSAAWRDRRRTARAERRDSRRAAHAERRESRVARVERRKSRRAARAERRKSRRTARMPANQVDDYQPHEHPYPHPRST